jgi:hypothetical protein
MVAEEHLEELRAAFGSVSAMVEAGIDFVFLPRLVLPEGCTPREVQALLCLGQHGGYTTRLFLQQAVPARGANWSSHAVVGKTWWTWSWNQVPAGLRPAEILAEHLRGLR